MLGQARNGTLTFSVAARHGFIAESFLRAAVHKGALSKERHEAFGFSLETVLSELSADMHDVISGNRDEEDFLSIYGHLRPGTYDILSPKYADRSDLFVGPNLIGTHKPFKVAERLIRLRAIGNCQGPGRSWVANRSGMYTCRSHSHYEY